MRVNKFLAQMAVDWMDKDNRKRLKKVTRQQGPNFTYDINYAGDKDFHHCFDLLKVDESKRLNRLLSTSMAELMFSEFAKTTTPMPPFSVRQVMTWPSLITIW
jgi:hypothetical protein